MRTSRHRSTKKIVDGITFDSKAEARRYGVLVLRQRAGEIVSLRVHPRYTFIVNCIGLGTYRPDFDYYDNTTKKIVVEDVKGFKSGTTRAVRGVLKNIPPRPLTTEVYQIKKRLMLALYGIEVVEVA